MGLVTRRKPHEQPAARLAPLDEGDATLQACAECGRLPLIGERVSRYAGGELRCELCRTVCREPATGEALVKHSADGPRSRVRVIRRLPV